MRKHRIHDFAINNNLSIWLGFMVLIVAATMMHPTFASLIAIFIVGVLVFLLRTVAHIEGCYYEEDDFHGH